MMPVEPKFETDTPEPRFYLHKVCWPEETLSHIAKWYTGTVKNWNAIAKANPELDPKKIDIGDTISIPEDLMTSHKPMPHSFVQPAVHKNSTPRSLSNKKATPSESSKLFGPIVSKPSKTKTDSVKLFGPVETQQPSKEPDTEKLFGPIE
jgi:LysM repeat protein